MADISSAIRQATATVIDTLNIAILHRPRKRGPDTIVTERYSVDFLVKGMSLFATTKAGERDMAGCFWVAEHDAPIKTHNQELAEQFTFERPATEIREMGGTIERHRVMLFVSPECGDLGCGAITANIAPDGNLVVRSRFGYQNNCQDADGMNWDDFDSYKSIGPFRFAWDAYKAIIRRAAAV